MFGIHKNTVRKWVKDGLTAIDNKRPMLILGPDLVTFLQARKFPAEIMAVYSPVTAKFGNLIAICPDCNSIVNRRVSLARIWEARGNMEITFPKELRHICYLLRVAIYG